MRRIAALFALALTACTGSDPDPDAGVDPNAWQPAFDADSYGWLMSVWGPSPDNLYIVGGTPDEGAIYRYDGNTATKVELGFAVPLVNWVFGFGPDDLVAVGNEGTILRYRGSAWTQEVAPTDQNLWGVWGSSSDNLWAVGTASTAGDVTLLHTEGGQWVDVPTPEFEKAGVSALFKVWGTAADNVYAVGQRGVVLHYDGVEWTEILVGTSDDLISLWGTGPDRIAIIGGRSNGQIVTYDGTEWTRTSLAPLPGLNGVWMRSPDTVHVVGIEGTVAKVDFETKAVTRATADTTLDFHSVFGDASGRLNGVGGSLSFGLDGPYRGIAFTRGLEAAE